MTLPGTVLLLFPLLMSPQAWAGSEGLWDVNWRSGENRFEVLKAQPLEVQAFFEQLSNVASNYEDEEALVVLIPLDAGTPHDRSHLIPINYVSHQWLDLNSDGTLELLVTDDPSGRGFFHLNVIFQHSESYSWQSFNMGRGNQFIIEPIQDIDRDGVWEILIEERVGLYHGAESPEVNLVIRGFDGLRYVDMTTKHPGYYKQWKKSYLKSRSQD